MLKIEQEDLYLRTLFHDKVDIKNRRIMLSGEVNQEMFQLVEAGISYLEGINTNKITLVINSGGGDVYEALAIVGRIKSSKCKVDTEGYGSIMSAATLIFASGHKRKISRFAMFMSHEGSYELEGKHSEIVADIQQKEYEEKLWAQWMAEFSNCSSAYWRDVGVGTDKYFSPDELVSYGVADKII